eukprot:g6411.t1
MREEADEKARRWEERYRDQILARCEGAIQPKRGAVRGANHAEYYCAACRKTLTTTAGAMQAHHEAHARSAYTWIYQVKGPDYRAKDEWPDLLDKYRPEQHQWNNSTGRYFGGSDAVCMEVRLPEETTYWNGEGVEVARCRKCKAVEEQVGDDEGRWEMSHGLTLRLRRLETHERGCKRKPVNTA